MMLKRNCCELNIELELSPIDPILIKSGYTTVSGPSMAFIKTWRNGQEEVFLPGSSLKGVIRSHAEKICRTLEDDSVCIPYLTNDNAKTEEERNSISCSDRFDQYKKNKSLSSKEIYQYSCPACRMFGSTHFVGRFSISDAYAVGTAPEPEQRDGIAIDRFTGGTAQGAKFDMEVVTSGIFKTNITVRNFELWQLGLLEYIFMDFNDGLIRVGSGKSRGLGRVKVEVKKMGITYFQKEPPTELKGLDFFLSDDEKKAYGVLSNQPATAVEVGSPEKKGKLSLKTFLHSLTASLNEQTGLKV